LANEQVSALLKQLEPGWEVVDGHHLKREYPFKDFKQALAFVNRVGELAEQQQHHPDLYLTWGRVVVTLWTHKIDALTENDFRLAAKIDALLI
jgi:4a-hydroxytetrahydrobiopterin dehydratase